MRTIDLYHLPPLLLLLALGCHHTAAQSGVQSRIVTGAPVDKERDVEEVDPGLLQDHYNVTGRPASRQFNGGFSGTNNNILPGSSGSDFPSNTNFIPPYPEQGVGFGPGQGVGFGPGQGNGYRPGQGTGFGPGQGTGFGSGQGTGFGSGQGTGFGTGQGVGFGPGQGVGFGPGQVPGVFPGESGQGVLPGPPGQGASNLPPGSVSADTVAFTATRASSFTRNGISQVRFDFTVTDVGYGWLADRSEFSCYYPGLYYFTFNGLSSQNRQFKLSLVRNNQEIVSAWGDLNGYQTGSNSAILALNSNDRVFLVLQEGSLHESASPGNRGYTSFSGYRIR